MGPVATSHGGTVTVGIDIGQKRDPTAIAVVETQRRVTPQSGREETYHLVRHLERVPLGTAYPQVAARLVALVAALVAQGRTPGVFLDATGVGQGVLDLVRAAGVTCTPVYFTAGAHRRAGATGQVSLGKGWLVARLQALMQTGRLLLPQTAEAAALARELGVYEMRVDQDAHTRYGAFMSGAHDDLVTALGLAVQAETGGHTGRTGEDR